MKVFYILVLVFLVACSVKTNEKLTDEISPLELTSFEKIFTDSEPAFNGYELGEALPENIILTESLSKSISFTSSVETAENKINAIKLEIHVENEAEAKVLIESILEKYNVHFDQKKSTSNFVTWAYTANNNLPAQVILIHEKEFSTISLDIEYKSQR